MKFLPLIWRNLWRRKFNTLFTTAAIFFSFVLFGALMAFRAAFSLGVDVAGADRLVMIHKVSFIQLLPGSYKERIRAVEGVKDITHANWFGGIYQDPSNFIANMAVEPESFLRMYPEFDVSGGTPEGVSRRPYRRHRRRRHDETIRLEGRRPDPADIADLPEARRNRLGIHDRRHL